MDPIRLTWFQCYPLNRFFKFLIPIMKNRRRQNNQSWRLLLWHIISRIYNDTEGLNSGQLRLQPAQNLTLYPIILDTCDRIIDQNIEIGLRVKPKSLIRSTRL